MKRILTILASVAMVFSTVSCEQESAPTLSFAKAQYVLLADAPLTVEVVTDVAPSADLSVSLAFTGEAVLDQDFSVSSSAVVIPAGEVKGSVTITPLNNFEEGKNILVSMILPAGYEAGKNQTATIAVDAKEMILYSFSVAQANVVDKYVVKLNLSGSESGNNWKASADMEIPYTITPAVADGGALTVADDVFVVKAGENVATLVVNAGEVEGDPVKYVIAVDQDKAGERYAAGTNASVELTVMGAIKLSSLVGTWSFEEVLDLEEMELWFMEYEDDPELLPTHNEGFTFTVTENDGVYTLTTSGTGDWAKYFKECQIDYTAPINMCAKGVVTGPYTSSENQMFVAESEGVAELDYTYFSLSSVYRNFDGDAEAVGQGAIAITYDADKNLIVLIKDYDQPAFGEMWWDGFEPDMFSFASRFVKAE